MIGSERTLEKIFGKYIKQNGLPWIKAGLIDDAPEEARKAYKEWVKIQKELQAEGIQ